MSINEILTENGMTKYRLAKLSGVPHATLNDICSGKTRIEKCSGETLYKLAKVLSVPMETLLESAMTEQTAESRMEQSYEYGLPGYLQKDLDAYKEALKNGSTLIAFGENCTEASMMPRLVTEQLRPNTQIISDKSIYGGKKYKARSSKKLTILLKLNSAHIAKASLKKRCLCFFFAQIITQAMKGVTIIK